MNTKPKILVIDDEKINIKILRDILKDDGEILFALDPRDGIEKARQAMPDVILLDVVMPEMDGYEVCKELKSDPALVDIPSIFVTAQDTEVDEERGLSLGAIDYVAKPLRPAIIRARVQNQLALQAARKKLEELAHNDSLTGAANRRHFLDRARSEFERCRRHNRALSTIYIDLDYFKLINDSFGHAAGDAVLMAVSGLIQEELRSSDVLGRLGGEEFVVLLPETNIKGAELLANRLREIIELSNIEHDGDKLSVSASMGVTSLLEQDERFETVLNRADQACYISKNEGRNRVSTLPIEGGSA